MPTTSDNLRLGSTESWELWRIGHPGPNYPDRAVASGTRCRCEDYAEDHRLPEGCGEYQLVRQIVTRQMVE